MTFKRKAFFTAKILFSCGLIVLLFSFVDIKKLLLSLKGANNLLIFYAFIMQGVILLFQSIRQYFFLSGRLDDLWLFVKVNFVTVFVSNFLPGNTTGEIYKMWIFKKKNISYLESFSIIALDKLIASMVIFLGGMIAFYIKGGSFFVDNRNLIVTFAGIIFIGLILIYFLRGHLLSRLEKVISIFKSISPRAFVYAVFLACIAYVLRLSKFYFLIGSLGSSIDFSILAIVLLAVQVSTLLPLSFGSYGVMEGGIVMVLVAFGVDEAVSLSTAILNRFLLFGYSIVGGTFFLQTFFREKANNDNPAL